MTDIDLNSPAAQAAIRAEAERLNAARHEEAEKARAEALQQSREHLANGNVNAAIRAKNRAYGQ